MRQEQGPSVANKLIEQQVENLTVQLKDYIVKNSPKGPHNRGRKLLYVPEDSTEESLDSNDESYDRKLAEKKKKKRKKELAEKKRLESLEAKSKPSRRVRVKEAMP